MTLAARPLASQPLASVEPTAGGGGATVAVPAGALTLTGFAPTVVAGSGTTVAVPAGALTLTGNAPVVLTPVAVAVPAGALTLTGNAPAVLTPRVVAVPAGALTLTGNAPTVTATQAQLVAVPAASLVLTGFAPTVVGATSTATAVGGVGARPRRRRHFVEIDGKHYEVHDQAQAVEILTKLHEAQKAKAAAAAAKAVRKKAVAAPAPPTISVVERGVDLPPAVDFVHQLRAQVDATNARIAEEYRRALHAALIAGKWAKDQADEEDEIEELIAMGIL